MAFAINLKIKHMSKAKPFVKWVGGKGQLIEQLDAQLPFDFGCSENITYIEPFVGGGAMLFYLLQKYPNIKHAVINDINEDLTCCYKTVRDKTGELIKVLKGIEKEYWELSSEESKKEYFLTARERYNGKKLDPVENTALFFFLNRTCFNGLYRVNKKGSFNVPFGKYEHPQICDEETLRKDGQLLKNVEITTGDFEDMINYADNNTFFYMDPPYRPLSETSYFNDYSKEAFNDDSQMRLKHFCDKINDAGHKFMLSNSDSKLKGENVGYFDDLYKDYHIKRVWASRSINANPEKRGKLTEILVRNYNKTRSNSYIDDFVLEPYAVAENQAEYGKEL